MNISTASTPDINPDQIISNRSSSSTQNNENGENSKFACLVHDAEKTVTRPEEKKEAYSTKEDNTPLKAESVKKDNEVNTGQSESRLDISQETGYDKSVQQLSQGNLSNADSGKEGAVSEVKTEKELGTKVKQSDLADHDIHGNEGEDTVIRNIETANTNAPVEETAALFEQALSTEIAVPIQDGEQALSTEIIVPNQGSEQAGGEVNVSEEAGSTEVRTDTETMRTDANTINNSLNRGEPSLKENIQINNINTERVAASEKQQGNTVNDKGHINNESKDAVIEQSLDEISAEEFNAEDGQEDSGTENKAFNKNTGFGNSDLEELSEDIEIDEELKEKIKISATREVPDRYAKKTVIEKADSKAIQSHINAVDPEVLEELNDVKTLQDRMLAGSTQHTADTGGTNNTFKGVADTTLNSLETFNSNTTIHSAEQTQNQAMTMAAGKAGAGLAQGNAARTAGFSELLNQVVYVAKGRNNLGVTVNHEEFGKLKINVSMDKGVLNIHVHASDKVVREFLESNVQSIVESLSKDGVSVGGFSVGLKDHQGNPEKKFLMENGLNRQYEHKTAAVSSARGLVNVFA